MVEFTRNMDTLETFSDCIPFCGDSCQQLTHRLQKTLTIQFLGEALPVPRERPVYPLAREGLELEFKLVILELLPFPFLFQMGLRCDADM